ncbi:MAG TPA: HAMP domain-containing sensor histidine kinase [Opitutaceae bacterium]
MMSHLELFGQDMAGCLSFLVCLAPTLSVSTLFMPHGHCYFWSGSLITLHAIADTLIVLSYYSIPATLLYFVRRRRNLEFHWMFVCFAIFILACGTTHLFEIWNIWHADYWLSGGVKAITALASVPTAVLLVQLVPQALALPSPAQLRSVNNALQEEVAERKRFQHALQSQNIELEKANQAKDIFLATMSHELRTPLNAILGFTGTMLMKLPGPLTGNQEKQLRTVQHSARHLLSLINDLLDLAKIDSGSIDLHLEPVDVAALVAELIESLGPLAHSKNLNLEMAPPVPRISVVTDRRALNQILINLVSNAIKFTSHGGVRIVLDAGDDPEAPGMRIRVIDTGCGITPEQRARLFQPFDRGDNARARRTEGTGLGLYLSSRLSQLLDAELSCESEDGKGTIFTLAMKRPADKAPPEPETPISRDHPHTDH